MTFRTRVALALIAGAMLPLALLAYGVRKEMSGRLRQQADARVQLETLRVRESLAALGRTVDNRLERMAQELANDNRFRLALAREGDSDWLRDWGSGSIGRSSLDFLELVDSTGTVLSSGHFRNEFGRRHAGLAVAVQRATGDAVLVRARTPEGSIDVLGRARTFSVAGREFTLLGGMPLNPAALVPGQDPEVSAVLVTEPSASPPPPAILSSIPISLVVIGDSASTGQVALVVIRDPAPFRDMQRSVDRWFLAAGVLVLLLAAGLALWLASRVTRPVAELAEKTSQIDLDRLDQRFSTGRTDELGALASLLDDMTQRLRTSAARLREAERRAATGDLARQINHDVKNGLAPIRHVLRHLAQVAQSQPEQLVPVYLERRGTLDSGVEYLENLARNYARLSPVVDSGHSNPNTVIEDIARSLRDRGIGIQVRLADPLPPTRGDNVALRRILENLTANAVDALGEKEGTVSLVSEVLDGAGAARVRITVGDTGRGMSQEELNQAFDDFYTTKERGTGLGLSVVRRLIVDLGGSLTVETAPGQGSRFIVELPVA
jgi:signal transduction histidine kinase